MNDLGVVLVTYGASGVMYAAAGWLTHGLVRAIREERAAFAAVDEKFAATRERWADANQMAAAHTQVPTLRSTVQAWREAMRPTSTDVEDPAAPDVDTDQQWPDSVIGLAAPVRRDPWEKLDVQREVLARRDLRAQLREPRSDTRVMSAVDAGQVPA